MTDEDKNKIYLKISVHQGEANKYDEYLVVNDAWELLGQYEAAIDLTEYVGKKELSSEIAELPALEDISKLVCIDENGKVAGVMTKEQVASVLAGLMGVGFLEKDNYHDINEVGTYTTYSNTPQTGPVFSIQCGDSCIQESMSYGGYSLMVRSYNHVDGKWNEWKSIAI